MGRPLNNPKIRAASQGRRITWFGDLHESPNAADVLEVQGIGVAASSGQNRKGAGSMSRNPITGLSIAKDDQILFESYQYARTDHDRFVSQSMVKSITSLLIGIAISEGAIKSVDDTPETYVTGFRGSEYGRTSVRDLLHMSSRVDFGETRDGGRDLNRRWNGGDCLSGHEDWHGRKHRAV